LKVGRIWRGELRRKLRRIKFITWGSIVGIEVIVFIVIVIVIVIVIIYVTIIATIIIVVDVVVGFFTTASIYHAHEFFPVTIYLI
jgi:hypothetical protein